MPSSTLLVSEPAGTIFGFRSTRRSTSGSPRSPLQSWTSPSGRSSNCQRATKPRRTACCPLVFLSLTMAHRLFGTAGVRGKAGDHPLDHETVARLGAALVRAMRSGDRTLRFIAGRDTRESGEWIERELARGVRSEGAHMTTAGVLPTPAVAYVTREMGYDAGLVISASHNPFEDNGIKVFSGRGEKFTETLEREVEAIIADGSWSVD